MSIGINMYIRINVINIRMIVNIMYCIINIIVCVCVNLNNNDNMQNNMNMHVFMHMNC